MSTGAGPAPEKPEEAQAAEKGSLSPWFMPPPMDSMLDFWDRWVPTGCCLIGTEKLPVHSHEPTPTYAASRRFYPLKLFNTLTRKKVSETVGAGFL